MRFDEYGWDELPVRARDAAALLGYDGPTWDADDGESGDGTAAAIASTPWASLTDGQREAAGVLGYDETTWDDGSEDGDGSTSSDESSASAGAEPSAPRPAKDRSWSDLTGPERWAAGVLGYDGPRWDDDDGRESAGGDWAELTDGQREAAAVLGYDARTWDGGHDDDGSASSESSDGSASSESSAGESSVGETSDPLPAKDRHWSDLTGPQREAAAALGYDESRWEEDDGSEHEKPESASRRWSELSDGQRVAAGDLGYDESTWDETSVPHEEQESLHSSASSGSGSGADGGGGCLEEAGEEVRTEASSGDGDGGDESHSSACGSSASSSISSVSAQHKHWSDLNPEQRAAASVLGYDESKWEHDWLDVRPPCAHMHWTDLNDEMRAAAGVLGYDESNWDHHWVDNRPESAGMAWGELTESQREAAGVLGYDGPKWDDASSVSSSSAESETSVNDKCWSDLTADQQAAAGVLEYDEANWDDGSDADGPPTTSMAWCELTEVQRDAARVLGYEENLWDGTSPTDEPSPPSASDPGSDADGGPAESSIGKSQSESGSESGKGSHAERSVESSAEGGGSESKSGSGSKSPSESGSESRTGSHAEWSAESSAESGRSKSKSGSESKSRSDESRSQRDGKDSSRGRSDGGDGVRTEASSERIPAGITVIQPAVRDRHWSDLTADQQAAAAALGYGESNWDGGPGAEEPPASDSMAWCELTAVQCDAARVLGYDEDSWDGSSSDSSGSESDLDDDEGGSRSDVEDGVRTDASSSKEIGGDPPRTEIEVEREIRSLEREIESRRRRLDALVSGRDEEDGPSETRYGRMLRRHEDRANSLLRSRAGSRSQQRERRSSLPSMIAALPDASNDVLLHEVHHTLPAFASLVAHCLVWISTYALLSCIVYHIAEFTIRKVGGWNLTDKFYDASTQEAMFYTFAIFAAYLLVRMTGSLYEWNDRRDYGRRVRFHARNRWVLGCWDARLADWFDGGETGRTHGPAAAGGGGGEGRLARRLSRRFGPKAKTLVDAFGFVLAYYSINRLLELGLAGVSSDRRNEVLDGLPSRVLARKMRDGRAADVRAGNVCGDILGTEGDGPSPPGICPESFDETMFVTDAWNWVSNHNRCGWVVSWDGTATPESLTTRDGGAGDSPAARHAREGDGMASAITGRALGDFKPWGDEDPDAWLRELNRKDDEYLRSVLSYETYMALVGDPTVAFTDMGEYYRMMAVVAAGGLVYLRWAGVSFNG